MEYSFFQRQTALTGYFKSKQLAQFTFYFAVQRFIYTISIRKKHIFSYIIFFAKVDSRKEKNIRLFC